MDILGYDTGPIVCQAAFTADFAVPTDMPIQQLVNNVENERPTMDVRPGMRHKYTPLRFDPATSAHQVGGRYLFDSWDDVVDYVRFTSELEFEPGVKFWDRPFFLGVDKHSWHVTGAHDFTPMATTHYVSRLERFTYGGGNPAGRLADAWPRMREAAEAQGLASICRCSSRTTSRSASSPSQREWPAPMTQTQRHDQLPHSSTACPYPSISRGNWLHSSFSTEPA
jgi:hypothetical protein